MREDKSTQDFHLIATGIGTVPFLDVPGTCLVILERLPQIPFWPQFPKRGVQENMTVQFSEGLPFLALNKTETTLVTPPGSPTGELTTFYERFLDEDVDFFAISREYAPGLFALIDALSRKSSKEGAYIKGHTVGPVTFAIGIPGPDGNSILAHPDILDATVKGLAIKALWQVRALGQTGRRPILFLDEPSLSGYGSAFSPIQRHQVVALLKEIMDYLRERSDVLIGIHCCGNTDWAMLVEAGPDIVSMDAFGYMDTFLLYRKEICRFLEQGGCLAWGIVPTREFTGRETVEELFARLEEGFRRLEGWGLDPGLVRSRSLLTPSCGMGTLDPSKAMGVLDLLSLLRERCRVQGTRRNRMDDSLS